MSDQDRRQRFVSDLADAAFLEEPEAVELTRDFLDALAEFVDREVWESIASITPIEVSIDWSELTRRSDPTIEDFLLTMSDEEQVETRRSADHARAVAETIKRHARPDEVDQIARIRNEGILSLFETTRGELTSPDAPTRGVDRRTDG